MASIKDDEDDIFDESIDEKSIGEREWLKTKSDLLKEGFRDGVTEGQESRVQLGFNSGYRLAAKKEFQLAKLRGEISAILSINHLKGETLSDSVIEQLNQLIHDIRTVEDKLLKADKSQLQNIMVKEGQGHLNKKTENPAAMSSAESQQQEETISFDMKKCGDACSCNKNTDSDKQFCDDDCACKNKKEAEGETTAAFGADTESCTTPKLNTNDSIEDTSLLNDSIEYTLKEFKNRLKDIYTISPEVV